MTYCLVDGKKAYPSTADNIKITRENPYLKHTDSYTYDINFPLSIMENRIVFGAVNRIDVRKKVQKYKSCRLYVGNRLVISGTGIVNGSDSEKVKLQIVAGVSEMKYNARAENLYIDTMDAYPEPASTLSNLGISKMEVGEDSSEDGISQYGKMLDITKLINNGGQVVGDASKFVFHAIHDQTNDLCCNAVCYMLYTDSGGTATNHIVVTRPCIQPNLMMVLKCVINYMGYSLESNRFDTYPWNRLVVANAHVTMKVKNALPHWTVSKFLDEFCNFFNATIVIDDTTKKVSVVANNEVSSKNTVTYECEDDISTEYDEDGIEYIGTSNIKFDRENEDGDIIDEDVLKEFDVKTYETRSAMWDDIKTMGIRQRLQTIFVNPAGYSYFWWDDETEEEPNLNNISLKTVGQFSPLERDVESDSTIELHIVPAAAATEQDYQFMFGKLYLQWKFTQLAKIKVESKIPTVDNNHDETKSTDLDYITVKDAIEDGESKDSSDASETMPVMFVPKYVTRQEKYTKEDLAGGIGPTIPSEGLYVFRGYCDPAISYYWGKSVSASSSEHESNSLSLIENYGATYHLGTFHKEGNIVKTTINPNEQIVIKFLTDDLPDPKKIFRFRNKLFLCSKIEITIKDDGIEEEKTGYFYEI